MPPDIKDMARLWDMLDHAKSVLDFIKGLQFDGFMNDRKTRSAVERNLEIIGEAARRVSEQTRAKNPDIQWQAIVGLRNIIAHEYGEILYEKIWLICQNRLPVLIGQLETMGVNYPPIIEER